MKTSPRYSKICGRGWSQSAILFNADQKAEKLKQLEARLAAPGFWDHPESANKVVAQLRSLKAQMDPIKKVSSDLDDALLLWEMAEEADDDESRAEVDAQIDRLCTGVDRIETASLLSGKYDGRGCYVSIYSREGGTEAQDWAEMLLRMYLRYCETMSWKVEEIDRTLGDEAGLKDVTLFVKGPTAYGYLSAERGTHRLARVSPFNAQGKRQTSFAAVDVVPEFDDEGEVEIDEKDLDITMFARSSGPGGQNVNKLATAVRMLHKPTGLSVVCSVERSQEQNKRRALSILRGKLEILEEQKRQAEIDKVTGGKLDMGWGTQIRSYVIYDNRVKDTRTGFESTNPQRVLDGDLQGFIAAELRRRTKLGDGARASVTS